MQNYDENPEMMEEAQEQSTIERDAPDPAPARAALVAQWTSCVRDAREFWHQNAFKRMLEDQRFAAGNQWQENPTAADHASFNETINDRYVANITLRHIQSRTASIYGKNPKVVARRKERLLSTVWDGNSQSLQTAMQTMQMGIPDPQAMAILQDAQTTMQQTAMLDKMAKSLELMFEHEIDEQPIPFKVQMKATVRRALTTAVGYVKVGFERVMARQPDIDRRIEATEQRLSAIERLAADMADGEFDENAAEAEELRLVLDQLMNQEQTVVREGLTFNYPDSTSIIPDPEIKQLRGFVGATWAAEEYYLTSNRIKEVYQKDISMSASATNNEAMARTYLKTDRGQYREIDGRDHKGETYHAVWEIYDRSTGMSMTVCDGYGDFLQEPASPEIWLERFFPWFPFVVNEVYDDDSVIPPSDVRLMRDMQKEVNRNRQGLREHRVANRPKTYVRSGILNPDEKDDIQSARAHSVIELQGLQPNEKIQDVLQAHAGPGIDPALYDPSPAYQDYLRAVGQQEANLGGTSGATATEAAIAEGSRNTSVSSTVDDLDEFLTELTRCAGQTLLLNMTPEKVKKVLGPGAVWPDLDRESVAQEIFLEIEAASTGRPNKQQEIQNAQAVFPLLMQIPGMSPEWLAKELLRRMDDRLDVADAFAANLPSIQMMNNAQQMTAGGPNDPNAQGSEGGNNAPSTSPEQVNAAPRPPEAGPQQQF